MWGPIKPLFLRFVGWRCYANMLSVAGTNIFGGCAGAALDAAEKVAVVRTVSVRVRHGYGDTGLLDGLFAELGAEVTAADYGAEVARTVTVLPEVVEVLVQRVVEVTSGRAGVVE